MGGLTNNSICPLCVQENAAQLKDKKHEEEKMAYDVRTASDLADRIRERSDKVAELQAKVSTADARNGSILRR